MSRSSKLSRSASVKSALTGMISIAAFMGSCPPAPVIGHDPGDLDQPQHSGRRPVSGGGVAGRGRSCRRTVLLAAIGASAVQAIGPGHTLVHLLTGRAGGGLAGARVGQKVEGPSSDGGVPVLVGQDLGFVQRSRLGIDVSGESNQRLESGARLRLTRELKHGETLEGRAGPAGDQPVEERFPLGKRPVGVGIRAERTPPCAQALPVAVLVVELTGEELADLRLWRVGDPGGQELHRPKLVVHALAHAIADLLESKGGWRVGVDPDVTLPPEGGVLSLEVARELPRVRHGRRKRMRPKNASDELWVSFESMDSETAAGLSGASP